MNFRQQVPFAGTYFFYFAILGVIVPYLSLFLDLRGFNSLQIGQLLSLITLTRIVGPSLWAMAADRKGQYLRLIRIGCVLTTATFFLVFPATTFWQLTWSLALFCFFWSAILPQLEVLTLNALAATETESRATYGGIRLWGSLGFIAAVMIGSALIDAFDAEVILPLCLVLLLAMTMSSWGLYETSSAKHETKSSPLWQKLKQRRFLFFFTAMLLLQSSFGPFYTFFSLYSRDLGYSTTTTGLLISAGVVAEVLIYLVAMRLIRRVGLMPVTLVCLLLTVLRWYGTGHWGSILSVLFLMQSLHAASFALTQAATIQFVREHFSSDQQSRGQAIFIGLVFGGGSAIGAVVSGMLWEQGAGATHSYNVAAWTVVVASVLILCNVVADRCQPRVQAEPS